MKTDQEETKTELKATKGVKTGEPKLQFCAVLRHVWNGKHLLYKVFNVLRSG